MKQSNNIYLTLLALIIILYNTVSCSDDKGNYTYHEINDVVIEKIDTLSVQVGDTLRIKPTLTFTNGGVWDDFTYEWYIIAKTPGELAPTNYDTGLIATGRDLKVYAGGAYFKTEGLLKMMYKVTEKTTGVARISMFYTNIRASYISLGYLALCEKPIGFDIDMLVLNKDTLSFYPEILNMLGSDLPRSGRTPRNVVTYNDNLSPQLPHPRNPIKKYAVIVLSDKATDRLNPNDFSYKDKYNISNISTTPLSFFPGSERIAEQIVSPTSNISYMYANNNWFYYFSAGAPMYYLFGNPINRTRNTEPYYRAAPYIYLGTYKSGGGGIIYDIDSKRFMLHHIPSDFGNSTTTLSTVHLDDMPGDKFKWHDPNRELIYMSQYYSPSEFMYVGFAIVKDVATNKYSFLQFDISNNSKQIVTKRSVGEFESGSGIENAKFFARHPVENYLYYASEDKITCVYITTMKTMPLPDNTIPNGHKISLMKYLNRVTKKNALAVATYDPNGIKGSNGSLKFFNTDPSNGELSLSKHPNTPTADGYQIDMSWNGFGKIAGLDYKAQ